MTASRNGRIVTFYSYKGGTGRTMALANTAWILAANGKRVLAVDWDLEAPGLDRFFGPFLDLNVLASTSGVIDMITKYCWAATADTPRQGPWHVEYAKVERHAVSLTPERFGLPFAHGGSLDFLSAGKQNQEYSATVSSFEWDNFYERLRGGLFLDALRQDMKATYDYVLIDSRTGLSETADICTLQLPDVVVDCFTLSGQSMDGAAAVARSVERAYRERHIRVLPVPMRIDEGEKTKADAARARARMKFEGLPKGPDGQRLAPAEVDAYWGRVEIPYRPYYAYEETLATIGDRANTEGSLLSAFERLTKEISEGEVTHLPPFPEQVRLRCLDAFTQHQQPTSVLLVYAAGNRMWADWVEALLKHHGCTVIRRDVAIGPPEHPPSVTHTVVLLSTAFQRSRNAEAVWRAVANTDPDPQIPAPTLVPVRVDEFRLPDPITEFNPVDLHLNDQAECVRVLLDAVGVPSPDPGRDDQGPRFPGNVPHIWNAPPRNATFTGRDLTLDKLRRRLSGGVSVVPPQPQVLFGLGGVGKTQVALEYAHRFMADYDLVWWISAKHIDSVLSSLAELGSRLGVSRSDNMDAGSREAVRCLARGEGANRWLLVFDNADKADELIPYFPKYSGGHIVITSRNEVWTQHGAASLAVDVFLRRESIEHISLRAPGLCLEEADQVAEAVGDLPLAVEQAAAWLAETATPVEEYLRQLAEQSAYVLNLNQPPDYPTTVAATWNVSIDRLKERSPASVRLLQLCAFMAPEPIPATLLYSREMQNELRKVDPSLQETLMMGRVIKEISRLALAKVEVSSSIQVHRLVQAVIRSQLTDSERRQARHIVHTILAGARPDGDEPVDNPKNWAAFEALWAHLRASEIRNCVEPAPRRMLIDHVRYLWKRGDFSGARQQAEELLNHWTTILGEDDVQFLFLRFQYANVLRSTGNFAECREINKSVLAAQRRILGPSHPHTYMTTTSRASDLAVEGRASSALEAVVLASEAHIGFKQIFDESHPRTLSAANNLALALRMIGRYEDARDIDEETYRRRREVLGPDHPYTLASAARLGRDLRAVGHYTESVTLLAQAYADHKRTRGKEFPGTLTCATFLAVSLRRSGQLEDARRLTMATRSHYATLYRTAPTPDFLACDLNLAADLHAAFQRKKSMELAQEARDVAENVRSKFSELQGETHPFTLVALNNLGIYLAACGEVVGAAENLRDATDGMATALGEQHPHTLLAQANHANVLAEQGRFEDAWVLEQRTLEALKIALGAQHPETLAVVGNSALTLRSLGQEQRAERSRSETLSKLESQRGQLGEGNDITQLVRANERVYRDLEPLQV
ncbi:FxSxx-COOH system tetratricopeptide repeat protein [Streptomyces ossamyceticus]|uniref:FxSxx-COOH system tetratricopeptide repeat protein n=1 Tax=Streptomyces ossamyceticus TaxID=249581 RepID=A0ABV2V4T5_9ACTN